MACEPPRDLDRANNEPGWNYHNMRSDVGICIAYHSVGGWVIWVKFLKGRRRFTNIKKRNVKDK